MFVCVHNAGRSQMAAALFNLHARGRAVADSAGTQPAARVHPEVVQAMREVDIDLSTAVPKQLTTALADGVARAVTMGCGDECPTLGVPIEDWPLPDPAGRQLAEVRVIRDEIDRRVRALLMQLLD